MNDIKQVKRVRKPPSDPFQKAGGELVQIRFQLDKMLKGFSAVQRKDSNYRQLIKDIHTEVEKAIDPNSRDEHKSFTKWYAIIDIITHIVNNKVFLVIICIVLGALLGNIELLKTLISFIKG